MAQHILQAADRPAEKVSSRTSSRLFFIDHLRAALVILVVLHHVAMVYGASAPYYYVEPPFTDPDAFKLLLIFALFNQAWFMGAFSCWQATSHPVPMIAGEAVPSSRKS